MFLRIHRGDKLDEQVTQELPGDKVYALSAKFKPGLVEYRIEFGLRRATRETVLHTAGNIVCGDAYIINGQSNAVTEWGKEKFPETSEWIRTFGSMGADFKTTRWGRAIRKARGGLLSVGYWGFDLAKHLVEPHKIPICISNGAVGGTRIDQHLGDEAIPGNLATIYGRLLWRVREARLTLGIEPPGTCHYPPEGYADMARLVTPPVERDNYGTVFDKPVTPPNLGKAYCASGKRDEIALESDQPVVWKDALTREFYLDGGKGEVASGAASGNVILLKLKQASTAKRITYLDSKSWSQERPLTGGNGIAALTFCEAPIMPSNPGP